MKYYYKFFIAVRSILKIHSGLKKDHLSEDHKIAVCMFYRYSSSTAVEIADSEKIKIYYSEELTAQYKKEHLGPSVISSSSA